MITTKIDSIPKLINNPIAGTFEYPDEYVSKSDELILFDLNSELIYFSKDRMHKVEDLLLLHLLNTQTNISPSEDFSETINELETKIENYDNRISDLEQQLCDEKEQLRDEKEQLCDEFSNRISRLEEQLCNEMTTLHESIPDIENIKKLIITAITNTNKKQEHPDFKTTHQLIKDFNNFKTETIEMITALSKYQETTYSLVKDIQNKTGKAGSISETTLLHLIRMITNKDSDEGSNEITVIE